MCDSRRSKRALWVVVVLAFAGFALAQEEKPSDEAKKVDPSGTWKWERTFGDNHISYTLRIKLKDGKITGSYAGVREGAEEQTRESVKIDEGKLDGNKLSFKVTRSFNDREFTLKYHGTVSNDSIQGTTEIDINGETREFDWDAKRGLDVADVLGTWQLTIETPDGNVFEPTLKLAKEGDKLKGTYISDFFGEVEAQKINIKDTQLSFELSIDRDGNAFSIAYKCSPRGEALTGTYELEINGEPREGQFQGKRMPEEKKEK